MNTILKAIVVVGMGVAAFAGDSSGRFSTKFPIQVGNTQMPAGRYSIEQTGMNRSGVILRSLDSTRTAFVALPVPGSTAKEDILKQEVVFHCAEEVCSIQQVKNLSPGYTMSSPKPNTNGRTIAVSLKSKTAAGE